MQKKTIGVVNSAIGTANMGCTALTYSMIHLLDRICQEHSILATYYLFDIGCNDSDIIRMCDAIGLQREQVKVFLTPLVDRRSLVGRLKTVKHTIDNRHIFDAMRSCSFLIDLTQGDSFSDIYGEEAKESAQYACYKVLLEMLKMFGIYVPHITEEIYQNTFKNTVGCPSIHNLTLEKIKVEDDDNIINFGDDVISAVSQVRGFKTDNKISLKTKLELVSISCENVDFFKLADDDIKAVTSAQSVEYKKGPLSVEIKGVILEDK